MFSKALKSSVDVGCGPVTFIIHMDRKKLKEKSTKISIIQLINRSNQHIEIPLEIPNWLLD
ncbi:hypothetical protein PJI17_32505, partial [Mycobacterium kansasii]